MMLRKIAGTWLLIILSLGVAGAQVRHASSRSFVPSTLAITYNAERAKISPSNCGCFWFQGGAADADWPVWNSLSIAAQVSGARASNVAPDVDIKKINFLFGPRCTWQPSAVRHAKRHASLFGEFLVGGVHAFNTVIPTSTGAASSATAFALQTGAGTNLWLTPHFGFRVIELDYSYSRLPNAGDSTQNDLRIATGLVWNLR